MHLAIALLAALAAACGDSSSPTEVDACTVLSESRCLESVACTLVQPAPLAPYVCRAAADSCEAGFRQTIDPADRCEAEAGCVFDPGECYCPPGLVCFCSGGPPPQCRAA